MKYLSYFKILMNVRKMFQLISKLKTLTFCRDYLYNILMHKGCRNLIPMICLDLIVLFFSKKKSLFFLVTQYMQNSTITVRLGNPIVITITIWLSSPTRFTTKI